MKDSNILQDKVLHTFHYCTDVLLLRSNLFMNLTPFCIPLAQIPAQYLDVSSLLSNIVEYSPAVVNPKLREEHNCFFPYLQKYPILLLILWCLPAGQGCSMFDSSRYTSYTCYFLTASISKLPRMIPDLHYPLEYQGRVMNHMDCS